MLTKINGYMHLYCHLALTHAFVLHNNIIYRKIVSSNEDSSGEYNEAHQDDLSTDSHDDSSSSDDEIHCLKKPTSPIKYMENQ